MLQSIAFGQVKVKGTITDKNTLQPVEYANIGIFEKGVGTVSNTDGNFEFIIPAEFKDNPITVKHLGYKDVIVNITEVNSDPSSLKIELEPSVSELKEVIISATRETNIGYKPNGEQVKGFFKAAGLGLEGGTLIKNNGQILLTQFNLNILKIPFDSLKFRVNFYAVKNNKPYETINKKDIVFTVLKSDTGAFSLPLQNEKIQVTDNFICAIELIELFGNNAENAEFLFSAIPNKEGVIYKKTISMGKWERIKNYSLCFWFNGKK
jgi:hypothetical protein